MKESKYRINFNDDYDLFMSVVQVTNNKEFLRKLARRLKIRTIDYYCNGKCK